MVKLKMNVWIAISCLACVTVVSATRGKPPTIVIPQANLWKESKVYVRKGSNATFHDCSATATPEARYFWTFNGEPINQDNRTVIVLHNGTLKTGPLFGELHSGDYQCYAKNDYGTAMTPILKLVATDAFTFTAMDSQETERQAVSLYLPLKCNNVPKSIPPYDLSWVKGYFDEKDRLIASPVQTDDRVVVDPQGTLHFLWLDWSDNNMLYACMAKNRILLISVRNTQVIKVKVENGDESLDKKLSLKYNKDVEVFAGEDAELVCIFAYYSAEKERVNITWTFGPKIVGYGTKLSILKVKLPSSPTDPESQEGDYVCTARLGDQVTDGTVNLKIVGPPKFVKKPAATNVLRGEDAVMHCDTYSHNTYSEPPVWFINAKPLIGCPDYKFECKTPLEDEFSECISEKRVCNAQPECGDGSEEFDCPGICVEDQKLCFEQCVPKSKICNETCVYPRFLCEDGKACLPPNNKCDGITDCFDESDEIGCPDRGYEQRNRYMLNSVRTELIVPQVGLQDSMCIQCLVRNEYGSTIGDACITVIDKIIVLRGPNSTYYVEPGMLLDITVDATTDLLWQKRMSYSWYWYAEGPTDKKSGETKIVPVLLPPKGPYGRFFHTSQSGQNIVIQFPDVKEDDRDMYNAYYALKDRVYTLVIEHNYDRVELNFTITGLEIIKPTGAPVVEAAATNLWFIALILAILILFIVVALIVCYMYRNRGGTYLLGKKERQAGHDPAQELKDSGFHDVGRVDDDYDDADKPRADEASLSESVKPYESDDDPTEEYGGDFDVSKFNEDGSFIGLYGDKKSKYSTKEATV